MKAYYKGKDKKKLVVGVKNGKKHGEECDWFYFFDDNDNDNDKDDDDYDIDANDDNNENDDDNDNVTMLREICAMKRC